MVVVTGNAAALRIKERIKQGLYSNMAYVPVPVTSVQVAEPVSVHVVAGLHHSFVGLTVYLSRSALLSGSQLVWR
jgi:hypothetical protein